MTIVLQTMVMVPPNPRLHGHLSEELMLPAHYLDSMQNRNLPLLNTSDQKSGSSALPIPTPIAIISMNWNAGKSYS